MKKYFLLFGLHMLLMHAVHAQTYVTIPDINFRAALKELYPDCFNSSDEMDVTCSGIVNATQLYLPDKNISDLDGIQYFTKLTYLGCSDNKITSISGLPSTLTSLVASNNKISTIEFSENLTHIEISENLLTAIPAFPSKLDYFDANHNLIESLPPFPSTLQRLFVGSNMLSEIPVFPSGMYDIVCSGNKLTSIPNIPTSLQALFCGDNFLTSLPAVPQVTMVSGSNNCFTAEYISSNSIGKVSLSPSRKNCNLGIGPDFVTIPDQYFRAYLEKNYGECFNQDDQMNITCSSVKNETTLNINGKNVSDITGIEYFTSLTTVDIGLNDIEDISNLPESIIWLSYVSGTIKNISKLPPNLTYLDCSRNLLESISGLPNTLTYLNCSINPYLTSLPTLPDNMTKLYCYGSSLEILPVLPNKLEYLDCHWNRLTSLPVLPTNLISLDCSENFLTELPFVSTNSSRVTNTATLPGTFTTLNAANNCFNPAPQNPNPSVLVNFVVTPNRSDCKIATAVKPNQVAETMIVYPNPATDKITIEVPAETSIRIYNTTGQMMFQKTIVTTEDIDVSTYLPGMYYYSIGDRTGKLIVQ